MLWNPHQKKKNHSSRSSPRATHNVSPTSLPPVSPPLFLPAALSRDGVDELLQRLELGGGALLEEVFHDPPYVAIHRPATPAGTAQIKSRPSLFATNEGFFLFFFLFALDVMTRGAFAEVYVIHEVNICGQTAVAR